MSEPELDDIVRHVDGQGWRAWAACRGGNTADWFPERDEGTSDQAAGLLRAREVCAGCTVRADCLDFALAQEAKLVGMWGGLSERERKKLRLGRRRAHLSSVPD